MGNTHSRGGKDNRGFDLGKAAYVKRLKRRQSRLDDQQSLEKADVGSKGLIDEVATKAAESLETQNEIKEHDRLTIMGAIHEALMQGVRSNPLWVLWSQIQRSRQLEAKSRAGRKLASVGSDVLVAGGTCISLWLAKKIALVCAPALWVINGVAKQLGFGPSLLLMGDFSVKGHKYFGIGMKERHAFIFGCLIAIVLYLFIWRIAKLVIKVIKKLFAII